MVQRHERLARPQRQRLGKADPDNHTADQARPGGRHHTVEGIDTDSGLVEGALDDLIDLFDMGAGRDLGHNTAVLAYAVPLAENSVGQNPTARRAGAIHDRRRRFIAGRLYAKYQHGF